ncbi:MAG: sodium/proton-translocating pyrophosphatase, partial [Terriglobales bacterium]
MEDRRLPIRRLLTPLVCILVVAFAAGFLFAPPAHAAALNHGSQIVHFAQANPAPGGEAQLIVPDLNQGTFLGTSGRVILMWGLLVCALGLLFGFMTYSKLRSLPVHKSMREVSELIWETCKTYLITQGKFLFAIEALIALVIVVYFGYFDHMAGLKVFTIFLFSVLGILGSYSVAW